MGRVSLNPVRHLDPLGTILIFLVGFGWGKPVEFRPQALASKRFGAAIVALAGPLMNFLLACASAVILLHVLGLGDPGAVAAFLEAFFFLNVILAVFNLLPIPPLDGSRLLTIFLPPAKQHILFFLDRYGILILILLLIFGDRLVFPLINAVVRFIIALVG